MQPVNTYRLQLTPEFGFEDAAAVVPYLQGLGVTHLYCSPWLESEQDSQHGYDVVDHSQVDTQLGGAEGLDRLIAACRADGLGIVLDIVPNHMSVGNAKRNRAWWSLLAEGQDSPYAAWFDVDWSKGKLLVPVLGAPLAECLGDIEIRGDSLVYYDHEFPLAKGTLVEDDVAKTLEQQHYRLAFWRNADELNYRRFFDVTTLAGVRVEDLEVFDATHELVLQQVRDGVLDGLRIDHPDGLADPEAYLRRLRAQAPEAWIVVEKILEPGEELPDWACDGTTGYDALQQVLGLFVDPAGERALSELSGSLDYGQTRAAAKRQVLSEVLVAEVERLLDLAVPALETFDITQHGLREALTEMLVAFGVYRAYVAPHGPADAAARAQVQAAVVQAQASVPRRAREAALLGQLALAEIRCPEFVTRFQQTCGPVMAKGVEDTTFYRYNRLLALNEVGSDPAVFGNSIEDFHAFCGRLQQRWPLTMTALSTHDTKRSEDVRARLATLTYDADDWVQTVTSWSRQLPERLDVNTEQLIWQTLAGAWPLSEERAIAYAHKAVREAKSHTSWLDPQQSYEDRVASFVRTAIEVLGDQIAFYVQRQAPQWRSTLLAQKLVQLTMPGVADTYQGSELVDLSLVDPDNRRPVDYARRSGLLANPESSLDAEKLFLVSTCLRLRRDHPEWFLTGSSYEPLPSPADTLAFSRSGQVITVVPLRGDASSHVTLPVGDWRDLLPALPVSLFVRA